MKKARVLILVFLNAFLKNIRMSYMSDVRFIGRYVDVEIERRNWAKKTGSILIGEKNIPTGLRKVHEQIVFYVPDNLVSKWLGFKKNKVHYQLAGWFQSGSVPKSIGGITLEGKKVKV